MSTVILRHTHNTGLFRANARLSFTWSAEPNALVTPSPLVTVPNLLFGRWFVSSCSSLKRYSLAYKNRARVLPSTHEFPGTPGACLVALTVSSRRSLAWKEEKRV